MSKRLTKKNSLQILAVILVVLIVSDKVRMWIAIRNRNLARQADLRPVSVNDSIEVRMHFMAEVALSTVSPNFKQTFDYSTDSIRNVDVILEQLPQAVSATNGPEELASACLVWGAYVGEAIRKQHTGGQWSETVNADGQAAYPLKFPNQTLYPCEWTVARVTQGPSASIWKKYESFVIQNVIQLGTENPTNTPVSK